MATAHEKWSSWRMPDGFQAVPSALAGFEVFGPVPVDAPTASGPSSVRCPQCGASARFDVALGAVACAFCGWADTPSAAVVGRDASDGEFTRQALDRGTEGFGVDRRELSCEGCGALLALEAGAMAASCPFCASSQVSVREHTTVSGLRPTAILPFTVDASLAQRKARTWLRRGWFHPGDLGRLARVDAFVGVYTPYWLFSADVGSRWEAKVGTARTVTQRKRGKVQTSNVIDWAWRSGAVALRLRDLLVPGTSKVSGRLLGRVGERFALEALVAYEAELLAGFQAQTYDVALPDAWEAGRMRMREQARDACMADTGSPHVRSFSMTADLDAEAWRHVLLPLWISAYRYGGRTFVVLLDGSTGDVSGQKPIAWWKVWTAIAALLFPGVSLGLISLPLLLLGVGGVLLAVAAVLLVIGAVAASWVHEVATESEAL